MTAPILALAAFCMTTAAIQFASIAIAIRRFRRSPRSGQFSDRHPPVSLVRPLCGIDNYADETLVSTFTSIIRVTKSCSASRPPATQSWPSSRA